jgi:arginyl-tRNA synthetase
MFQAELDDLGAQISQALTRLKATPPSPPQWIPIPFAGRWGYGTTVCFQAAAAGTPEGDRGAVAGQAQELARQVAEVVHLPQGILRLEAERAYLNAYFDSALFAQRVVDSVLQLGEGFGHGPARNERVMVEYAQPNTHHSFHIGHARATLLGESLARIVEFAGFDTVRAAYPGDMGLGVITCVWAYQRFYVGQEPEGVHARGRWLANIYTEANQLLTAQDDETDEERSLRQAYDAERREMYRLWDVGDPYVRALWEKTRQWSLDELHDILHMLNIDIDVFFYESEVAGPAKQIVDELIALGIAEDERPQGGPVIIRIDDRLGLKKEKYRTAVILRGDGTTLYLTNDLALAKFKFEDYNVDRSVYVVDVRQSLHFQQVFKILELWGFPQASKCFHLAFGIVSLPEGAMSSRRGNVVYFMDVAEEAVRRVKQVIAEKNPGLDAATQEQVAQQVGLGALTYAMLSVDNLRDTVFDMDAALSLDGQSAPYIQNAHVRATSILRKAGRLPGHAAFDYELEPLETALVDLVGRFPAVVQQAAKDYKPLHMASYTYDLAKAFHAFYHAVPVLQAPDAKMTDARLRLTAAARQTLANSLRLLDIEAPDVM